MASYKQRKELWLERARQIDERNAILARNRWHPFASLPHHELIEIPHHRIVQIESTTQQAGTSTRGELTKSQSAFDGEEARRDGAAGSASVPHKDHHDSLSSEPQGLEAGAQPPAAADPLDAHEEGEEGEEAEESVESVKCREAASKWKEQMDKQLDSRTLNVGDWVNLSGPSHVVSVDGERCFLKRLDSELAEEHATKDAIATFANDLRAGVPIAIMCQFYDYWLKDAHEHMDMAQQELPEKGACIDVTFPSGKKYRGLVLLAVVECGGLAQAGRESANRSAPSRSTLVERPSVGGVRLSALACASVTIRRAALRLAHVHVLTGCSRGARSVPTSCLHLGFDGRSNLNHGYMRAILKVYKVYKCTGSEGLRGECA